MFSGYSQARVSTSDMLYGLERLGVNCGPEDGQLLVTRYDSDGDQKLGFWEFSNIFMPADGDLRDDLERKQAVWEISASTKDAIRHCLRRVIDSEQMVESIRQRIDRETSVSLRSAFDSMDRFNRGYLSFGDFQAAFDYQTGMTGVDVSGSPSDLDCLIKRFNKDKLNGRVSMPEFIEELTFRAPEKKY